MSKPKTKIINGQSKKDPFGTRKTPLNEKTPAEVISEAKKSFILDLETFQSLKAVAKQMLPLDMMEKLEKKNVLTEEDLKDIDILKIDRVSKFIQNQNEAMQKTIQAYWIHKSTNPQVLASIAMKAKKRGGSGMGRSPKKPDSTEKLEIEKIDSTEMSDTDILDTLVKR